MNLKWFLLLLCGMMTFNAVSCKGPENKTEEKEIPENSDNRDKLAAPVLLKDGSGGGVFISNGKKHVVWGTENDAWRSLKNDLNSLNDYIDGLLYINANTIALHLPWGALEPVYGRYNFDYISRCMSRAENAGLKVIVYFLNSNYAAGDNTFIPEYVRSDAETYTRVQGPKIRGEPVAGHAILPLCPSNPALLERERKAYCELIQFIKDNDINRNVLAVVFGHEMNYYTGLKEEYMQWGNPEARCECRHCNAVYTGGSEVEFMTRQFADYIASVIEAGWEIYELPPYSGVAPREWFGGGWRGPENAEARKAAVNIDSFFVIPSIASTESASSFRREMRHYLPDRIPGNIAFASGIDTGHGYPGLPFTGVNSWPHLETAPWINIFEYKSLGAIYWDNPYASIANPENGALAREKLRAFWSPLKGAGGMLVLIRDMPGSQMVWWTYEETQKTADINGYAVYIKQEAGVNYGYVFADGDGLVMSASVYEGKTTEIIITKAGGFENCVTERGAYNDNGEWEPKEKYTPEISGDSLIVRFEGDNGDASRALIKIDFK